MAIKHATVKAPGQKLFAVADWNADHEIEKVDALSDTSDEGEVVYLKTDKHLYLNQTSG